MVKLIWNTTNVSGSKELLWGKYHQSNSDDWIFLLLKKINFKIIKNINEIEKDDQLIIIDSSIEKKKELYLKLNLLCKKLFLFHLGDEVGENETKKIYNLCSYTWRTFCTNFYFNLKNTACIPVGYKSGIKNINNLSTGKRDNKWTFIGTPHKSSRHDLLFQLLKEKPNFVHKTEKFNGQDSLNYKQMKNVLLNTIFVPSPNGFVHPETYRLYEALECGCIPIVENTYNYYDRLFPNNPFIKINKWKEAKEILSSWDEEMIIKQRRKCIIWWTDLKLKIQKSIAEKIDK